MCTCKKECGCNITTLTKGEKGERGEIGPEGPEGPAGSLGYSVYSALLNQSDTDAPIPTILQNTIGDIVWSYDSAGTYIATLTGAFTTNKTTVNVGIEADTDMYCLAFMFGQPDSITIFSSLLSNLGGGDDNLLVNKHIEIRVYP